MSLSSLSAHLTQALPAPLQHRLGLPPAEQNAPEKAPTGNTPSDMALSGWQNSPPPEQKANQPSKSLSSRLAQSLTNSKHKLQQLWPGHAKAQQPAAPSGIFTSPDAQAAAEAGDEPAAKSLGSSLGSSLGNRLENTLGNKLEPQLGTQLGTELEAQTGSKASKLWRALKQKLHLERPPHGQKPEQPGKPPELPPKDTPPDQKPSERPPQPQDPTPPGQVGPKPPLKRMEAPPGWKPGDPVVESGPWKEKIEPLNWEQLIQRRKYGFYTKTPRYSLTPDQIRVNYPRKQQECLEKLVYSMKWNDDDAINPFSEKLPTER